MTITEERNVHGYSALLASILYYLKMIRCEMTPEELMDKIPDSFWLNYGFLSANMNRAKMVYDLCERYQIENYGYDHIFSHMRELYRPEEEVSAFEALVWARKGNTELESVHQDGVIR